VRALVTLGLLCALATPAAADPVCRYPVLVQPVPTVNVPINAHFWSQDGPVRLIGPSGDVPVTTWRLDGGQVEIVPSHLEPGGHYRLVVGDETTNITVGLHRDATPPLRPGFVENHYALPVWPDTVVYEVEAMVANNVLNTLTFAIAADDTRIDPEALYCSALHFDVGDTICFAVHAIDAGGNRSPARLRCIAVDRDFYEASIPYCPSAGHSRWHRDDNALGAVAALSIFVFIGFAYFVVVRGGRALALAAGGEPTSIVAAQRLARRSRALATAITAAWSATVAAWPWSLFVICWVPVLSLPAAWRAHKALTADAATLHDNYVHIWRDGKLRSWLRVRPNKLAELAVPTARARRRGMLD
jgi:hypothetical protein